MTKTRKDDDMIAKLIMAYLLKHDGCINIDRYEIRLLYTGEYKTRKEWEEIFRIENEFSKPNTHRKF